MKKQTQFKPCPERSRMGQSQPDFFIDSIARWVYNCVVALLVIG